MEQPILSIIVPAYNIEKYLKRCLDSILNQSYTNFECIVVNDGSIDGTKSICDEYADKDDRVIVIHQENGGLSVARNNAMKKARGKYISFIDGDDYIMETYCETLINLLEKNNADIAKCDYHKGILSDVEDVRIEIVSGKKFTEDLIQDKIGSQLWQYVYKKELWNDIVSPKGRYAQDMMILHEVTNKAKNIVVTNKKLYFYFIDRDDSTSNAGKKKVKGAFDRAIAFKERYIFARKNGYDGQCDFILNKVLEFYNNALTMKKSNEKRFDSDMKILSTFLKENRYKDPRNNRSTKYRFLKLFLEYTPNLYCRMKGDK